MSPPKPKPNNNNNKMTGCNVYRNVYKQIKQIGNDLDNLKQLFLQVYGKGGKRNIRDNEELLCLAKDYDQAAIKLAYDIVTRRAANSVQLVEQLAKEEGWTIRQNLPLNLDKETKLMELKDTVQNSTLETFEHVFSFYWNNYDKIDERNIKHKDWKKIYQIVKTLKTYPEIFTNDLIEQYKKQITEGKISSVKRSISKTIDKWRLEHWDKLDAETKARIAIVYLHFRKYALERLKYKNYITFDGIKRIERKIGKVPTHVKSSILKSLGLRKNKNKKQWILISSKKRQQVDNWITEIEQILNNHLEKP